MSEVTVRFGGIVALRQLSFTVGEGEICALIGPNGAGKTTLFNVISRVYDPDEGKVSYDGRRLSDLAPHAIARAGIARTFQNLALWPGMSVLQNVMVGMHTTSRQSFLTASLRLGLRREERRLEECARAVLEEVELSRYAGHPAAGLPFGTLKRVELARAIVSNPRLLLLDEPASGLTHGEVDELAGVIRRIRDDRGLTVLLVEHHMKMVMGISDKVVVIDFGEKIAEGPPADVRARPARHRGLPGGAGVTEAPLLQVRRRPCRRTARCGCSTASTSTSERERSWWCSGPTGPARPR